MSQKRGISSLLISLPDQKRVKVQGETVDGVEADEENAFDNNRGYVQGPLDPIFGQRSAFPVVIDVTGVDLNHKPRDVNEYLAQVRLEACMDGRKPKHGDENREETEDASGDDYVYYKATNDAATDIEAELVVPKTFIDDYMPEFRRKRREYEDYRKNLHELDAIDLPQTAKQWKKFIWEVSCEKDYIAQIIEEQEHIKLLVYFCKWLSLNVNDNYREWLFGVLEAIEEVLVPSEMSVLRQLGKKALRQLLTAELASSGAEDAGDIETYKKVLVIVGLFYKQRDLLSNESSSGASID